MTIPRVLAAHAQLDGERIVQSWSPRYVLGASLARAQHLPSIESLSESYVACVQSAFMQRLDDFGASNLPQATEQAFLDCQLEEHALYTTAAASAPGNSQAVALARAAVEQLKAKLKAELLAAPTMPPKE